MFSIWDSMDPENGCCARTVFRSTRHGGPETCFVISTRVAGSRDCRAGQPEAMQGYSWGRGITGRALWTLHQWHRADVGAWVLSCTAVLHGCNMLGVGTLRSVYGPPLRASPAPTAEGSLARGADWCPLLCAVHGGVKNSFLLDGLTPGRVWDAGGRC